MAPSALLILALSAPPAGVAPPGVDWGVDGAVTLGALAGVGLLYLVPLQAGPRWDAQLLAVDQAVVDNFSEGAARLSDALLLATVIAPLPLLLPPRDASLAGRNAVLYSEALAVNLFVNSAFKVMVRRPRPYVYNDDAAVAAYVAEQGADAYRSFYSGHAATAFTAATAASMLFAVDTKDPGARAAMWAAEFALATATANLRVRAGKHFYSDVLIGAAAGIAVGVLVPTLHLGALEGYTPHPAELGGMAAGVALGALVSHVLPLPDEVRDVLATRGVHAAPWASPTGGGVSVGGAW